MSALKEKIQRLAKQLLDTKESVNLQEFTSIFQELKPEYDLNEEEIAEIFNMTDENREGLISRVQVERVLNAILTSVADDKNGSMYNGNELRLSLAKSCKKDSITSVLEDFDTEKQDRPALKILHDLDLDKISELKHIYNLSQSGNQEFVTVDQIKRTVASIKRMSSPVEDVLELFEYIAEGENHIIPKETFTNLMSELEKKILDYLYADEDQAEENLDTYKINPGINNHGSFGIARPVSSQIFSDSSNKDEESDEDSNVDNSDIKYQIDLILKKAENVIEGLKNKIRSMDLTSMVQEIIDFSSLLEKQFKKNEKRVRRLKNRLQEQKNNAESLNSKLYNFESISKSQEQTIYKLQAENDELNQRLLLAKSERTLKEHAESELKQKNNEIVRLERKLNELQYEKETMNKKLNFAEIEKQTLLENYKGLELLMEKMALEKPAIEPAKEEGFIVGRDSLTIQTDSLKTQKEDIKKEIDSLQKELDDLRKQVGSNKEFVASLKLEKNDLEKKLQKMTEEQTNLRKEVTSNKEIIESLNHEKKELEEKLQKLREVETTVRKQVPRASTQNFSAVNTPRKKQELIAALGESVSKIKNVQSRLLSDTTPKSVAYKVLKKHFNLKRIKEEEENSIEKSEIKKNVEIKEPSAEFLKLQIMEPAKTNEISSSHKTANSDSISKHLGEENKLIDNFDPFQYPSKASDFNNTNDLLSLIDEKKMVMDYLSLRKKLPIQKMLQKEHENLNEKIFYSDYIYCINNQGKRESCILFATGAAMYLLTAQNNRLIRKIPLNQIYRITVNESSAGLCALHVQDNFVVQNRGAPNSQHVYHYNRAMFNPELQSSYKSAAKVGELYLKEWSIFNPWKKYFFILTNIGLFYFKEVGSLKPLGFIPVIDYLLVNKKKTTSNKHEFKIKFQYSNFSVTLAAESELEKLDWVVSIHKIQEKAQNENVSILTDKGV